MLETSRAWKITFQSAWPGRNRLYRAQPGSTLHLR